MTERWDQGPVTCPADFDQPIHTASLSNKRIVCAGQKTRISVTEALVSLATDQLFSSWEIEPLLDFNASFLKSVNY